METHRIVAERFQHFFFGKEIERCSLVGAVWWRRGKKELYRTENIQMAVKRAELEDVKCDSHFYIFLCGTNSFNFQLTVNSSYFVIFCIILNMCVFEIKRIIEYSFWLHIIPIPPTDPTDLCCITCLQRADFIGSRPWRTTLFASHIIYKKWKMKNIVRFI